MTKYYQCKLQKAVPTGMMIEQAWIEEKGASLGARVELKGEEGLWVVTSVDLGTHMEGVEVAEKQRKDRNQRAGSDI
jgi:hypothetical protein